MDQALLLLSLPHRVVLLAALFSGSSAGKCSAAVRRGCREERRFSLDRMINPRWRIRQEMITSPGDIFAAERNGCR
jgi:hypothetical protein